jgi:uncharacterized protein
MIVHRGSIMLMGYYNENQNLNDLMLDVLNKKDFQFDIAGEPLVLLLARQNRLEDLKVLKNAGFKLESESKNQYTKGNTALHEASYRGYSELVSYLLTEGVEINQQNYMGNTPLMMAVINKQVDIVQGLLQAGAHVDLSDKNGMTPLMMASAKGYFEITQLLIEAGANKNHLDDDGETALDLAYKCGSYEIIQLLKNE